MARVCEVGDSSEPAVAGAVVWNDEFEERAVLDDEKVPDGLIFAGEDSRRDEALSHVVIGDACAVDSGAGPPKDAGAHVLCTIKAFIDRVRVQELIGPKAWQGCRDVDAVRRDDGLNAAGMRPGGATRVLRLPRVDPATTRCQPILRALFGPRIAQHADVDPENGLDVAKEAPPPCYLNMLKFLSPYRVETRRPVWKSKFYGAFVLNHRVVLYAIDATPARWRGDAGCSPARRSQHGRVITEK